VSAAISQGVRSNRGTPLGIAAALAGPAAVSALLLPLRATIQAADIALILVLVVITAAMIGGRAGGVAAALSAAVVFDFGYVVPYGSLRINAATDVETTLLLLVVGILAGELVLRSRRSADAARRSRREIERMRRVAAVGAGSDSHARLIDTVRRELEALLPVDRIWYEPWPFTSGLARLTHGRIRVPPGDPILGPLDPTSSQLAEITVASRGIVKGRFVLEFSESTSGAAIPPEIRATAVGLADQLGVTLTTQVPPGSQRAS